MDAGRVGAARAGAAQELEGLDAVDQQQLDRSFRVFCALEDVQRDTGARGLAVRCWPDFFTDYGCAACGALATALAHGSDITTAARRASAAGALAATKKGAVPSLPTQHDIDALVN